MEKVAALVLTSDLWDDFRYQFTVGHRDLGASEMTKLEMTEDAPLENVVNVKGGITTHTSVRKNLNDPGPGGRHHMS